MGNLQTLIFWHNVRVFLRRVLLAFANGVDCNTARSKTELPK